MRRFLAALRFLTIAPVPGKAGTAEDDLAGSVPFFPAVGLLLGAVAAAVAVGLSLLAPPMVAAAALVVLLIAFSGGLHLDGLSDTADGFLSSRPRDRVLEIMKDSRVGAMGVIAIVCVLLLKFAALASMPPAAMCLAALLMPLAGRCVMVLPMAMLDYVRPTGLGSVFHRGRLGGPAVIAMATLVIVAAGAGLIAPWAACLHKGAGMAPGTGIAPGCPLRVAMTAAGAMLAAAGGAVIAALLLTAWSRKKIGGATGDVYGAACELGEAAAAIVLAAWRW
jgi:cobalamin 5'-phosphate synthase/cobalamin synthase